VAVHRDIHSLVHSRATQAAGAGVLRPGRDLGAGHPGGPRSGPARPSRPM